MTANPSANPSANPAGLKRDASWSGLEAGVLAILSIMTAVAVWVRQL